MSRYIDAERLMNYEVDGNPLKYHFRENPYDHITFSEMEDVIDDCPTADVKPVVHANWETIGYIGSNKYTRCAVCTHCGKTTGILEEKMIAPFCCWCGAKMDEVD